MILDFGVPLEFDMGDNESQHIPAKAVVRLTQKIKKNFKESSNKRLKEKEVLVHACMEMTGMWSQFGDESPWQKAQFGLEGNPCGPKRTCWCHQLDVVCQQTQDEQGFATC